MGYGSKSTDIKESAKMGVGIHENVTVTSVVAQTIEYKNGDSGDVLDITFTKDKGLASEEDFMLRTFNPESGNETYLEKNKEHAGALVTYIASKVTGEESEIPDTVDSWKSFTKAAIKLIPINDTTLSIKLVGNVYNGKANIQVTRYWGWLTRTDSGKKLKFSQNELGDNAQYEKHFAPASSTSSTEDDINPF